MTAKEVTEITCDWCGENTVIANTEPIPEGWIEARLSIYVDENHVTPVEFRALKALVKGIPQHYCCCEHLYDSLRQSMQEFASATGSDQHD